jgi:hypothetical protein
MRLRQIVARPAHFVHAEKQLKKLRLYYEHKGLTFTCSFHANRSRSKQREFSLTVRRDQRSFVEI